MIHTEELTPISAVTSPDPYPYYRSLVAHRPLFRDEQAGMWVASSAAAVTAVLSSSALGVRPPDEPVPAGIVGTPAGEVFGRLVRMTDGDRHATAKPIVSAALSGVDAAVATEIATRRTAQVLDGDRSLARLLFKVPAGVVGELCGIALDVDVVDAVRRFVGCIPASATLADLAAASVATESLSDLLRPLLHASQPVLPAALRSAAHAVGMNDPQVLLANAIGLLSQTYDATAGLIGNTLVARRRDSAAGPVNVTPGYVLEVARHDPPIHNTRRFVHYDTVVLGHQLCRGEAVLAVLAAANRDPLVNADPDRFHPARRGICFTFGLGAHGCPGKQLAVVIATAVVRAAVEGGIDGSALPDTVCYRPLPNARIPDLAEGGC